MSLLMSNTERFNSQRLSRKQALPNRLWRQETPQRSASRSKLTTNKNKIMKVEKTKNKVPKKNDYIRKTQRSPHNTTQYIIDANSSSSEETCNIYADQDRFSYDFQHHMSAGSMMDLMGSKFSQMYENMQAASNKREEARDVEPVNSVNNCLDTDPFLTLEARDCHQQGTGLYSSYLEQAEQTGTDMQGLVRQLVNVLRQKDEQINAMKEMCSSENY